jgi:UPF0271 protein
VPGERRTVDLSADVGEASDDDGIAVERALLGVVTSAHVACGGHAGDEASMRATVEAALAAGVHVGAHPSYPDRLGFGRRPMDMQTGDLSSSLAAQLGALVAVTDSLGTKVHSVKPHGALYGEVARGGAPYDLLLSVMHEQCGADTALVLPAASPAVALATGAGVTVLQEGFADRAYAPDGGLVARHEPGSVYGDPALAQAQARELVTHGTVRASDGTRLTFEVDTICVHGDSPHALAMAQAVRAACIAAGVVVRAPLTRLSAE